MVTAAMKSEDNRFLEGKWWQTQIVLKSGDITLPTKVCIIKAMVFSVVRYSCESWTLKKAEGQRVDAFELLKKTPESRGQQGGHTGQS